MSEICRVTEEEVMFFDTDCGGVVHNLAYLRMIETCRTHLAKDLGLDMVGMAVEGLFPVLTRTEIDYRRPGKLGDRLRIEGRLGKVERVRFWCHFVMTRGDEVLVEAKQILALVKMPEGKVQRLPAALRTLGN